MSLFVAVTVGNNGTMGTSSDGYTWTSYSGFLGTATMYGVAWSPSLSLFVAVGASGKLSTSPDGNTWTTRTSGFGTTAIYGVAWSPSLSLFVAVGVGGILTTSPDGIIWTTRTSGFGTTTLRAVTWSPGLSLFVAVGDGGILTTSPDGITWTTRTSGFGTTIILGVAWSPGLSLFVAVGDAGTLATSPDGTAWTVRTGFGTTIIFGVAWSPGLSLFVAVGDHGAMATSPDGTTWSYHGNFFGTPPVRAVAWSLDQSLFVAVGDSGFLATSYDAFSWMYSTSGFGTAAIQAVAFGQKIPLPPPVATALTPTTGSAITTGKPTVGLTLNQPTSGQSFKGEWQFATDSGFTTDVILVTESDADLRSVTGATTEVLTEATRLTKEGVWYFRGRTVDEFGNSGPWTSPNTVTLDVPVPSVPTGVTPVTGTTVNTDIPAVQAVLPVAADGQKVKAEWQFATDSGFTADLRVATEPDSALRFSGTASFTVPNTSQLTQTLWYIRARTVDQYGQYSAYSASNNFTVTHPPGTSNLVPTGGTNLAYAATTPFSWAFGDTSPVDTQTAYQIIVERNDTSALVIDSGKVTSTVLTATLAISSALKDIQLRWKIQVWDSDDVTGGYGSYNLFQVADIPVLVITSPANASTVTTPSPTVTWTFTDTVGRTQASYRVTYTKVGDTLPTLDTGTIPGAVLTYTPGVVVVRNNETFNVAVTVTDSVGLSSTQSVSVTADYVVPDLINFSLDAATSYLQLGYVKVSWTYVYDSAFLMWRVYRRVSGTTAWTNISEITQSAVNEFLDWQVPANNTYEYMVVQVVERFDQQIESQASSGISITLEGGDYWLIDPVDSNNNCKLFLVKDDGYTDMYEMSEYTIVGRGRHVDYGESIGKSGSLSAQIRDTAGSTARVKKQAIEALKRKRIPVILRNPFGDVYNVSLGDIAISRIAGTGTSEYCDITVPYLEIF